MIPQKLWLITKESHLLLDSSHDFIIITVMFETFDHFWIVSFKMDLMPLLIDKWEQKQFDI
jgi:hypothetical protein